MQTTMNLLEQALTVQRAATWARELNVTEAAFTQAKKRGRLSPVMAGTLAEKLHEDAKHWMAIAAIEAEPDSPLRDKLIKSAEVWRKR